MAGRQVSLPVLHRSKHSFHTCVLLAHIPTRIQQQEVYSVQCFPHPSASSRDFGDNNLSIHNAVGQFLLHKVQKLAAPPSTILRALLIEKHLLLQFLLLPEASLPGWSRDSIYTSSIQTAPPCCQGIQLRVILFAVMPARPPSQYSWRNTGCLHLEKFRAEVTNNLEKLTLSKADVTTNPRMSRTFIRLLLNNLLPS